MQGGWGPWDYKCREVEPVRTQGLLRKDSKQTTAKKPTAGLRSPLSVHLTQGHPSLHSTSSPRKDPVQSLLPTLTALVVECCPSFSHPLRQQGWQSNNLHPTITHHFLYEVPAPRTHTPGMQTPPPPSVSLSVSCFLFLSSSVCLWSSRLPVPHPPLSPLPSFSVTVFLGPRLALCTFLSWYPFFFAFVSSRAISLQFLYMLKTTFPV